MAYSKVIREKVESIDEKEFREFIGEPLTRTRKEIMEHFNLNHATLTSLLRKYGLVKHTLTSARKYEKLEEYLLANEGTTYEELAKAFDVSYKNVYRAVQKRGLQDLIRPVTPDERYEKIKETLVERYGVESTWEIDGVIEKTIATNLERYGTEYAIASPEAREKIKETLLERYGVESASLIPGIQEKRTQTNLKRYGYENPSQHPDIIEKRIQTNLKRYGAGSKRPTQETIDKHRETMVERYGQPNLMKTPEAIRNARETLLSNEYRKSRGWYTINEDNAYLLLDVEAFKEELSKYKEKPTIIEFIEEKELPIRTVYNFIRNNDLQDYFEVRWNMSYPETEIYDFLLSLGIDEDEIILNDRTLLKPFEIDLYLPNYNIGIEFNGTYYHSTLMSDDKKKHQYKAVEAEKRGVNLYQIFEFDWDKEHKKEIIKSQIRNLLNKNENIIYARHCEIREVDNETTREFMEKNHMQGDGNLNKQINYGLYKDDELVYMMTFGKWRRGYKGLIDYEIFRSCSILNTTVVGGASKLFKHFLKEYKDVVIGTYSNLQTGDGSLYKILGFEYSHTTEPTSFKVDRQGRVFTMFSKEFRESKNKDSDKFYFEIYNAGSKLWLYNYKES